MRSVEELPPCFQPIFPSFKYFNGIQAEMLDFILSSARSFVVSAPTGSGKTVLLELAIVQMLMKHVDRATGAFNHKPGELKAIYMAPLKALVQEKKEEWIAAFGAIGVVCKELTGDTDIVSWSELNNVDILLTTPEKFDSITRKNKDRGGMSFFGDCALVMIDEVHLLGDERGGSLEAVVSRLKVLSEKPSLRGAPLSSVRFVACSATVPNLDDVGRWLGAPFPDGIRHFGEEYRPVRLETKVLGYDPAKNDWMFERRLNERLYEVVLNHFQSKPALVFCSSRDGASSAAKELAEKARNASRNPFVRDERQRESLREAAGRAENRQLKVVIQQGVAFHSASLDWSDRELCERLFRDRLVTVMCSTSTLSMGVNLPAFLCVVRGTRQYAGQGEYREIERSALLQMCGRAGRPQFDTSGVAVIMTQKHTRVIYDGLVHGTQPIESNLGLAMAEHVNAEIASGIIADSETAMDWLKHSFFYIRVTRNPRHYGIAPGKNPDVACGEIVAENLRKISAAHMCEIGEDAAAPRGNFVRPLEGGRVMSDMYIRFETMKRIMSVQSPASVPDLLMTLCESDELSSIKLRRDEKVLLKGWNLSKDEPAIVRFKVTEIRGKTGKVAVAKTIKTAAQKIYIIAQETMSDQFTTVLPPSMRMEVESVFQNGRRIMQGAARYYANVSKKGSFAAYCNALRLAKALDMRMWVRTRIISVSFPSLGLIDVPLHRTTPSFRCGRFPGAAKSPCRRSRMPDSDRWTRFWRRIPALSSGSSTRLFRTGTTSTTPSVRCLAPWSSASSARARSGVAESPRRSPLSPRLAPAARAAKGPTRASRSPAAGGPRTSSSAPPGTTSCCTTNASASGDSRRTTSKPASP